MARVLTPANMAASSGAINSIGNEQVVQNNGACWRARFKTSDLVSTVISVLLRFVMLPPSFCAVSGFDLTSRRSECEFAAKAGKMSFQEW